MALFDEHLREKIRNLPTGPGVYQYFDSDGNIIYIGKAKNLRNRVSSYLNKSNQILLSQNPPNMSQIASQNSAYAYLYYFLGQYEKALGFAEEAYKVFDSMHGEVHGDTLAPMGIKSRILSKIGRAQDAIDLCLKVIHIQKQLNGEVHNKVLSRCEHLAEIYENIGEYEKAKETLCDIVTILEKKHDTTSAFYKRIVLKIKQIRGERL